MRDSPPDRPAAPASIAEVLAVARGMSREEQLSFLWSDQRKRWRKGDRIPVEAYLDGLPELRTDADAVLDLVFREVMLREDQGETPQPDEFVVRFPHYGDQLQRQFALHQSLKSSPPASTDHALTVAEPSEKRTNLGATTLEPAGAGETFEAVPQPAPSARVHVPGYEILGELGRGGMGVVYKARQVSLGRLVALKMILSGAHASAEYLARFQREAEAAAHLQHPNIVQVYEVGTHEGRPYFSLEFVNGCNLAEKIKGLTQPPRDAARLVETLARAMHYAHQQGIIHRDLKPANILLKDEGGRMKEKDEGGRMKDEKDLSSDSSFILHPSSFLPKITDFGLAKRIDSGAGQTATGDILGTPCYMAPEQAAGRTRDIGPATDVYALGAILYEMLAGRPPFVADAAWDIVLQVTSEEPVSVARLQKKVPPDLATICMKCLEKEPHKRYTSAAALADDLRRFLDGEPIHARPISSSQRAWKWAKRRPALTALLAVSALALLTLLVGGWVYNVRLQQALQEARDRTEESRQHLVRLHVARGTKLVDEKNWFAALVCFTEALRLDQGNADRERMHRLRLASIWRPCPRLTQLWSHEGAIRSALFSADGRLVATASDDHTARVWDVSTGEAVGAVLRHQGPVAHADFSPDGRQVATASADGSARVWEARTGQAITAPLRHEGPVHCVAFSPDSRLLATAGGDARASLWDAGTGGRKGAPLSHQGAVWWVAFSRDGRLLVTASEDHTARIWDVATGQPVGAPLQHKGPVLHATFSPDSKRVLTAVVVQFGQSTGEIPPHLFQTVPLLSRPARTTPPGSGA